LTGRESEIKDYVKTVNNCVSLLLPPPDEFFLPTDDEPSGSQVDISQDFDMRHHGLTHSYNLVINIDHSKKVRIEKTKENSCVIDNLKDAVRLLKKRYKSVIEKWETDLSNCGLQSEYIEKVSLLKNDVVKCLEKNQELVIEGLDDDDESDDDVMEEVVKEGYEPAVLPVFQEPGPSGTLKKTTVDIDNVKEASEVGGKKRKSDVEMDLSLPRKQRLLALAPKLPYDVDLYHWTDDKLTAPTIIS